MGVRHESGSEDSYNLDSDVLDSEVDADEHSLFDEDDEEEDVKPSFKNKSSGGNKSLSGADRSMDLAGLKAKRAAENKRRREEGAGVHKVKQALIKKLKRKLTWAESNQIALTYVSGIKYIWL
jgi:hypothetical protein